MPPRNADDVSAGDASSQATTVATGRDTHGVLNCHPSTSSKAQTPNPFTIGIAEDRNKRWRRTMEDSHAFVYGFGGVQGQGFFGIFDGHAGKHAADWCGKHFHETLLDTLVDYSDRPVPDLFNYTFHSVDQKLGELAQSEGTSSGCTAVTVFLRLEDEEGKPLHYPESGGVLPHSKKGSSAGSVAEGSKSGSVSPSSANKKEEESKGGLLGWARRIRQSSSGAAQAAERDGAASANETSVAASGKSSSDVAGSDAKQDGLKAESQPRRVLYTANVGDARAVLCRSGKALRLTYDHKGSDAQEAKRITDAGGFVMNNRVNGVLAVTRSLGDQAMKEFVVGSPYTTETCLSDEDKFLIVACDGLWDVIDDQDAVDLVADIQDPQEAAEKLLAHALGSFSTDNTSVMVVRFASGSASLPSACAAAVAADQSVSGSTSGSTLQGEDERTDSVPVADGVGAAAHDTQEAANISSGPDLGVEPASSVDSAASAAAAPAA
ncbi:PP2C-domain-containing protein [Ceraceosorus guamensis]|uniref:PP2C-domain-containing protein n=1 Tax=Ceraceosorus guamensis TaxID=1522189 RepID=A0A316VVN7_9BASI|nr:PP2C-domain-containing protein [Ceraceosorus guamensis]PWN41519.1 PP2C-domain-containing protein [Ceraceosorus guamensis]